MEQKATDFTRRLLQRRVEHFCNCDDASIFFDASNQEQLWEQLFYATMGNPRNLGYILLFLYESNVIYGKTIGVKAIKDAARRYYEEKIEPYFRMSKFLHESFSERLSIYSLRGASEGAQRISGIGSNAGY